MVKRPEAEIFTIQKCLILVNYFLGLPNPETLNNLNFWFIWIRSVTLNETFYNLTMSRFPFTLSWQLFFSKAKKVFRQLQSILKIIKRIKIYKSFFKNWQCQPKLFLRSFTAPLFLSAIWLAEKVHNGAKIKRMKTFFFHVAGKPWTDNWLPTPLGSFQHVRVTFSKLSWNTGTNLDLLFVQSATSNEWPKSIPK